MQPRPAQGTSTAWWLCIGAAVGLRLWNAATVPLLWGYDAPGHASYVFYLDRYGFVPFAHQGWGYFHPPLHYVAGWLLAQAGDAEVLLRGLGLLGSALSLAIAGLAAWVVHRASPDRSALACVAFAAVAFLPVHVYASPMIGNEMTCAFLGAAGVVALIANERRRDTVLRLDVAVGLLIGLASLAKFTGALYASVALATIALRPLHAAAVPGAWRRAALRCAVVCAAWAFVAGPYYARNVAEYGTPFRMNRDYELTARVEAQQPPGHRTWRDFVQASPRLFVDPRPGAPHLLHSVWGTAYVNAWTDTRALWNRLEEPAATRVDRARVAMVVAGLPVTALVLLGAGIAVADVRRGRRLPTHVPLLLLAAATLAAFALFAVRVPRVSALKATYLFGLSLPWGVFAARGVEALGPRLRAAAFAVLAGIALVSTGVYAVGGVLPRRPDHRSLGAVHWLLGDSEAARAFFEDRLARAPDRAEWLEGLAAVELDAGRPQRALSLYEDAAFRDRDSAPRRLQLGVAAALAGDWILARRHFDRAVAAGGGAAAHANRGAVHAAAGDPHAAESDLLRALELDPGLAAAWRSLAEVRRRAGRPAAADAARARWRDVSTAAPRGYPYGVGVGLLHPSRRPLLWWTPDGVALARAPFRPDA